MLSHQYLHIKLELNLLTLFYQSTTCQLFIQTSHENAKLSHLLNCLPSRKWNQMLYKRLHTAIINKVMT